mmetsp:Transcript_123247/g.195452  ORF Transcript_123247/g.195452 Transcript_123247/m.195452 type:complete len:132 (+) Transcript_123247:3-398(+)
MYAKETPSDVCHIGFLPSYIVMGRHTKDDTPRRILFESKKGQFLSLGVEDGHFNGLAANQFTEFLSTVLKEALPDGEKWRRAEELMFDFVMSEGGSLADSIDDPMPLQLPLGDPNLLNQLVEAFNAQNASK